MKVILTDHVEHLGVGDPGGDLEVQAQQLLDAALAAGGVDNISLILARPVLD